MYSSLGKQHKRSSLTPPLKWHGGKQYLAQRIIALMPPRAKNPNAPAPSDPGWLHYVEPFAGGLAVLLANNPVGISEVANDLNHDLTRFWQVIASADSFERFVRIMQAMPFSECEWNFAGQLTLEQTDPVRLAVGSLSDAASRWPAD